MASIEIIGNDNRVLIDDNYKNMIIERKFTATFLRDSSTVVQGGVYTFSYSRNGSPHAPQLAVNATFLTALRNFSYNPNNGTYTWTIACEPSGIDASADFYLLFLPESSGNVNGMVQIKNSSNVLVFDSDQNYCHVQDNYTFDVNNDNQQRPLISGRKYAYVLTIPPYIFRTDRAGGSGGGTGGYPTNLIFILGGINFGNGFMQFKLYQQQFQYVVFPPSQPPPFGTIINTASTFLVIDVTTVT